MENGEFKMMGSTPPRVLSPLRALRVLRGTFLLLQPRALRPASARKKFKMWGGGCSLFHSPFFINHSCRSSKLLEDVQSAKRPRKTGRMNRTVSGGSPGAAAGGSPLAGAF